MDGHMSLVASTSWCSRICLGLLILNWLTGLLINFISPHTAGVLSEEMLNFIEAKWVSADETETNYVYTTPHGQKDKWCMSDANWKSWEQSNTLETESSCGVCRRWAVPLKITLTKQVTWQARNGRKASRALPRPRTRAETSSSRCLPIQLICSQFFQLDQSLKLPPCIIVSVPHPCWIAICKVCGCCSFCFSSSSTSTD